MVIRLSAAAAVTALVSTATLMAAAQDAGSIRGRVTDLDFEIPVGLVTVTNETTGETAEGREDGTFLLTDIAPGTYQITVRKPGYQPLTRSVVVGPGQAAELDFEITGSLFEMEEFETEELRIGGDTEAGLQEIRVSSSSLLDSISAELLSAAGASDAGDALSLVAGASVQDGKFAVVRGLPDRFVNSQINGVRLPTADEDKRAVQLDQFPSAVIESVRVSKTFTPDQQGDASGGAVNVVLKGIPADPFFRISMQGSYNSQVSGRSDFLTYDGGGVNLLGDDDGSRDIPGEGEEFSPTVGVSRGSSPIDYKWSVATGASREFDTGVRIGAFLSFFYERDSSFYDNGIDDSYWVREPGGELVPETNQGNPDGGDPEAGDFKTALFDVTQGTESVQWGGLGTAAIETDLHRVGLTYLYTRTTEDTATLAEDTRGKEYFFPGYDPDDLADPGNLPDSRDAAPYLRTETLEYTERTTETLLFNGSHTLPMSPIGIDEVFTFNDPVIDWTIASSSAELYQPDKRQFGQIWQGATLNPGFPPFVPPFITPAGYVGYKPAAVFTLGNVQRIWKSIEEESEQRVLNLTVPFEQWTETEGFLKFGVFSDETVRTFDQDTFSNFNQTTSYQGDFDTFWSGFFPFQGGTFTDGGPFVDVDYVGRQNIDAWYAMIDLPINDRFKIIGGARSESTELSIVNDPAEDATWFPPGATGPVQLNPGDADVDFSRSDLLPSLSFVFDVTDTVTLRGAYAETIARQTFKELTPIQQQEFLGGDIFIGNPDLQVATLRNYDLRLDWRPNPGALVSASFFHKDIFGAIENVQRVVSFTFTTPVNYPEGKLTGFELEARQDFGELNERLTGLTLGANATFINSQVTLPQDEQDLFASPAFLAPIEIRDMTNAPEMLYNLFATYDIEATGTQLSLFYTVRGDTLVAGAGVSNGNFVPDVYETEVGTLNFTLQQKIGDYISLRFQAKNLTDPLIESVYRSPYIGADVVKTSFTRGIDFSIGLSARIPF